MSSCWTFLLKRRRAFSRGSPSCSLTSAKYDCTSQLTWMDKFEFCSVFCPSQGVSCRKYIKMEVLLECLILRQTLLWRCKTGQRLRSLGKPVDTGKASWPLIYADFLR